ncbi:MAG: GxGYxYP domain-containing protein [Kiritimatiellales bacterium]
MSLRKKRCDRFIWLGLSLLHLECFGTEAYTFPLNLYKGRPLDERITVEVLQGIVNRDGPRLFLTETWTPYNQMWTNVYSAGYEIQFKSVSSLPDLIQQFRDQLSGVVLYDPKVDGTRYIAATLGGLDNLLPVAAGSRLLTQIDLPVKEDLTGRFKTSVEVYEWALKEILPRCNRKVAHTPAAGKVDGKYIGWGFHGLDYTVAEKGFIFNLGCIDRDMEAFGRIIDATPDQLRLYREILTQLESPALIFGYGEYELAWFDLLGEYGHTYLHWGNNLSYHAKVPAHQPEFKQKQHIAPENVTVEKNKYYVTFLSSEGDSTKGPLPFFFGSWFDPARGSVPMNWCMHPEMVRFPAMLEYYYDTATTNDYFVAMQVFNFEMKNLSAFSAHVKKLMQQADISCVIADFANPADNPVKKENFLRILQPLGAVDALFEYSTPQGYNRVISGGIPLAGTSMNLTYWYRLLPGGWDAHWQKMYKDPAQQSMVFDVVIGEIEKEAAAHQPPYLIVVYTDLHEFDLHCEMHREIAARLDPKRFKVVRLDEGMSALRQWNKR